MHMCLWFEKTFFWLKQFKKEFFLVKYVKNSQFKFDLRKP